MDLLARRESELNNIYRLSGRGFFFAYGLGALGYFVFRRGSTPYFRDVAKHSLICLGGTFGISKLSEKIAAEMYYN